VVHRFSSSFLLVGLVLFACGEARSLDDTPSVGESTGFTRPLMPSSPGTTTDASDSSTSWADDSEGSEEDEGGGWCSVEDEDEHWQCQGDGGGISFECNLGFQDCPEGEKCAPWSNDGTRTWNATRCSPIPPMPDAPGEACTIEGNPNSGLDSCQLGSMCWHVDPVTLEGECVAMCSRSEAGPLCDDPDALCGEFNDGALALCLTVCDPLGSSCADDEVCIPTIDEKNWVCAPGLALPAILGGGCEHLNVCGLGAVCATALAYPPCMSSGSCCAPICDQSSPECPDPAMECMPWYPGGAAPSGLEAVGICAVYGPRRKYGWSRVDDLIADRKPPNLSPP